MANRNVPFLLALALAPAAPAHALNNCSSFSDLRGQALVTVNVVNQFRYSPACVRISRNATVRFVAQFGSHPMYGGIVSGGSATIDPDSPIGPFTGGLEASVTFMAEGEFPYFCDFHYTMGMLGSILVDDSIFRDAFE